MNKIKTFFTSISMCKNAIKDTNPNIIISFMTEINIISIIANLAVQNYIKEKSSFSGINEYRNIQKTA